MCVMKKSMRLALISDDAEYAAAFAGAVAATQRGFSLSVAGGGVRPEAEDDCVFMVDTARGELELSAGGGAAAVRIGKYEGCSRICAEARAVGAAAYGVAALPAAGDARGETPLISFVGVEGGAGASSLALGLAAELSAYRGKKVLYLSFETVESPFLGCGERAPSRGTTASLLFAFLQGKKEGAREAFSVAPYLTRDEYGVMRFPPSGGLNRLRELEGEDMARFMRAVTGEIAPDVVVADWGGGFGETGADYMRASAFTVFVARRSGTKTPRAGGAVSLLSIADELGVDRSRAIAVMSRAPLAGDAGEADACAERSGGQEGGNFVEVGEDPYAFSEDAGRVSLSLATSFGTDVKRLADIVLGGCGEEAPAAPDLIDALFAEAA
jgi:MinD-like ATPase involved in chromosome partitioning or flagellar assembly